MTCPEDCGECEGGGSSCGDGTCDESEDCSCEDCACNTASGETCDATGVCISWVMEPATETKTAALVLIVGLAVAPIVLLRQPHVYARMVLHHALLTKIAPVQLQRCLGLATKDRGQVSPVLQAQTAPEDKDSLIVLVEGLPKNRQLKVHAVLLVLVFR